MTAAAADDPTEAQAESTALGRTLAGRVVLLARRYGERTALREKRLGIWRPYSWSDYRDHVAAAAAAFDELGVRPGDHVAILSDNRPEWAFADLGAQAIGARSVGVYATNAAADVAYVLRHSAAVVLVCENQEQLDKAIAVRHETPALRHLVIIDPRGTRQVEDDRLVTWQSLLERGRRALAGQPGWLEAKLAERDPTAPSMVVYTSGTTGNPKGALLSSANVTPTADTLAALLGVSPDDSLLSYLPLAHVAEKIFTFWIPLASGAVVHFGESIDTVREDLREVSPTVFLGVPRIWEKMHSAVQLKMRDASPLKRWLFGLAARLAAVVGTPERAARPRLGDRLLRGLADLLALRALRERLGLGRCRLAVSGAAPIAPELLAWLWSIGVPIHEGYGMTEITVTHLNPLGAARLGSVGKVVAPVEHRIADDGEILVRGPNVFAGYLHDDGSTRATVDAEGWAHTGDIGRIDADGYLYITGRKKEIIITSGGKNLSPERIENALKLSPFIKEAVAIGDRRNFVSALIQIDHDSVSDWAVRRGIAHGSFQELAAHPEVHDLVAAEVDAANAHLSPVEQVRALRLLPKELHQDDGELTATQKVRRRAVETRFRELVEQMYLPLR